MTAHEWIITRRGVGGRVKGLLVKDLGESGAMHQKKLVWDVRRGEQGVSAPPIDGLVALGGKAAKGLRARFLVFGCVGNGMG